MSVVLYMWGKKWLVSDWPNRKMALWEIRKQFRNLHTRIRNKATNLTAQFLSLYKIIKMCFKPPTYSSSCAVLNFLPTVKITRWFILNNFTHTNKMGSLVEVEFFYILHFTSKVSWKGLCKTLSYPSITYSLNFHLEESFMFLISLFPK